MPLFHSGTYKVHPGLPDPGPEVASGWPLSAAKAVKCAGRVLSSTMRSRGRSSEREEGRGSRRSRGRERPEPQARSGRERLEHRQSRESNAQSTKSSPPASFLLVPLLRCALASDTPSLYLQGYVLYCKLAVLDFYHVESFL